MNFFITLSLLLCLVAVVTGAQEEEVGSKMRRRRANVLVVGEEGSQERGGAGRGNEEEEQDLLSFSLSLSMPLQDLDFATTENEDPLSFFALTQSSFSELVNEQEFLLLQHTRFEQTVLGATIAKWNRDAASIVSTSSSNSSETSSSSSGTTSSSSTSTTSSNTRGGRSSKAAKTCDARLAMAKEAIEALAGVVLGSAVTKLASPPDDVITAACSFRSGMSLSDDPNSPVPVNPDPPSPNLDCPTPAIYTFFTEEEFEAFYGPIYGKTMREFTKYCECHQGYELDCINKIAYPEYEAGPRIGTEFVYPGDTGSKKWKEYCTFAGIWNGDIDYIMYDKLSSDVKSCGCYFVTSTAREMVDSCAGVDLFANYVTP